MLVIGRDIAVQAIDRSHHGEAKPCPLAVVAVERIKPERRLAADVPIGPAVDGAGQPLDQALDQALHGVNLSGAGKRWNILRHRARHRSRQI